MFGHRMVQGIQVFVKLGVADLLQVLPRMGSHIVPGEQSLLQPRFNVVHLVKRCSGIGEDSIATVPRRRKLGCFEKTERCTLLAVGQVGVKIGGGISNRRFITVHGDQLARLRIDITEVSQLEASQTCFPTFWNILAHVEKTAETTGELDVPGIIQPGATENEDTVL